MSKAPDETHNPWQSVRVSTGYENPWIKVDHHEVITPGGSNGIYGVVRFKNVAVCIVTLDADGNTLLVGQWRFALNRYSWEVPEGGAPRGEDTLACAKRELKEETGYTATSWTVLCPELHLSNSVTDEPGIIYLAQGLVPGEAAPEDTEELSLKRVPLTTAVEMALDGRITDMFAVTGLLAAERYLRML